MPDIPDNVAHFPIKDFLWFKERKTLLHKEGMASTMLVSMSPWDSWPNPFIFIDGNRLSLRFYQRNRQGNEHLGLEPYIRGNPDKIPISVFRPPKLIIESKWITGNIDGVDTDELAKIQVLIPWH